MTKLTINFDEEKTIFFDDIPPNTWFRFRARKYENSEKSEDNEGSVNVLFQLQNQRYKKDVLYIKINEKGIIHLESGYFYYITNEEKSIEIVPYESVTINAKEVKSEN